MADPIINAPPTIDIPQTPGAPAQQTIPGTNINVPIGGGIERLISVPSPFQTNAPAWFSPQGTVWAQMGCAVPQAGTQLMTNNRVIWDFNNAAGAALFDLLWKYPDRLSDEAPTYDCLWDIYTLLINGRNRLVAKTTPDANSALIPTKATPAPKMFLCFPVPFYGQLGCVNQYVGEVAELVMRMQTEAMQHEDSMRSFFITKDFFSAVYPYIKYLLVDMATKFFGVDPKTASDDAYVIPTTAWQSYVRGAQQVSFQATAATAPLNYVGPSANDLQRIRALTYEIALPFLQEWPDSQYKMSSGGIWANSASPASDPTTKAGGAAVGSGATPNLAATANPSIFATSGPPSA
jgi:hypothetical protein